MCFSRSVGTSPPNSTRSLQQSVCEPAQDSNFSAFAHSPTPGPATGSPTQPAWNPFGDDDSSNLSAEQLINKDLVDEQADGEAVCVCGHVCVAHTTEYRVFSAR
jgi:hypothetical protein